MNHPRETIYQALFAQIASVTGVATTGRRLQPWTKTPAQPAIFQTQVQERPDYGSDRGMPAKWVLRAKWWIYVNSAPNAAPDLAVMNGLIDQIEALFPADQGKGWNTLGGLVNRVRIDGEIRTDEGMLSAQAIAIVPLEIITT